MITINLKAPVVCSNKIVIAAKAEQVWSRLAAIETWSSWLTTVSWTKMNGSLKANTTFDWKTGGMLIHSKLHTVAPYEQLGWTGKVYGISAVHNWSLKMVGEHTEVEVSESMEGTLAWLFSRWFTKTLERDMKHSLMLLKVACEQEVGKLILS